MLTTDKINSLLESKRVRINYLKMLIEEQDWHGCQDCASDIREIEAEIRGLATITGKIFDPKSNSWVEL